MITKSELTRAIRKRASEFKDEELFTSPYLEAHVQNIIDSMCLNWNRFPQLHLTYEPETNRTASTDGNRVECNAASPLIRELPDTYSKFAALFGHISHETGHILYTDFSSLNPLRREWADRLFSYYPRMPRIKGAEEFRDYLNFHPNYRKLYVTEMLKIVNVMEDVYIENRIRSAFSGLATAGLEIVNKEKFRLFPSEKELFERVEQEKLSPLAVAVGLIQMKMLGFTVRKGELTEKEEEIRKMIYGSIKNISKELESLAFETDGLRRCMLFNTIFVKLQPLMPRPADQEKDSGDTRDLTEEETGNLGNPMENQERTMSNFPKGTTSPVDDEFSKEKAEAEKESSERLSQSETVAEVMKANLKKAIAEAEILSEDEKRNLEALEKLADNIEGRKGKESARFGGYEIRRPSYMEADGYAPLYQSEYAAVKGNAESLARKLHNLMKDLSETEECERGFLFGQRLCSSDLYRKDGRAFSRISQPGEKKKVIFSILVDCSGSMSGSKIRKARQCAILIEEALRKAEIPLMVAGHTTTERDIYSRRKSLINICVLPECQDSKDRYRLAGLLAGGNNIDGAAICYLGDYLLKRPEEIKVLIVISDGAPTNGSFYSSTPEKDTRMAIEDMRKKGIRVFGAFVDDYENVSALYSKDFSFDCSGDYSRLENELCRLVKRYVRISNS